MTTNGDAAAKDQVAKDIEKIKQQEAELQLERFDAATVWQLGIAARDLAESRGQKIAVEIRRGNVPAFLWTADSITANNMDWVRKKVNSALYFERSTYWLGIDFKHRGISVTTRYGLPEKDYATDGGCFPLRVKGVGLVGCLTISGLDQRADHGLAIEAVCKVLGKNYAEYSL
jgi:uncharacterized protein (UPF0303 family)